jgi:lysophospholipase L1-like esterase
MKSLILLLLIVLSTQPVSAIAPPPPTGALIWVALGDSLTEGDGDEDSREGANRGWVGRVTPLLVKARPGSKVINLGKSGWDSNALIKGDQGLPSQLESAVKAKPHLVTVWIGSNDLWYLEGSSDEEAPVTFTQNIDLILKTLKGTGAVVYLAVLDDQSNRPIAFKTDVITEPNRKRMNRFAGIFNGIIRAKAAEYDAILVSFEGSKIFVDAATLADDGNHPNAKGYEQIAEIWWSAMQPEVLNKARPTATPYLTPPAK